MSHALLNELLAEGIQFAPLYKPVFNSDHLPMALAAMHGLGAEDDALVEFRDEYAKRLQTLGAASSILNWQDGLGQRDAYSALLGYFLSSLEAHDSESLVNEVLGQTMSSLALDAFHPIIRLGYGVEFETPHEIAAGLAYMVSVHEDMPLDYAPIDLRESLDQQVRAGAIALETSRFSESLNALVSQGAYPVGTADSFAELASVAFEVYLATRNFFALHLVTSTQALRTVASPTTEKQALAAMTGAILASHLVLRSPSIDSPLPVPDQLDPEHAIKYAYSCLAEFRVYGDGRYIDEIRRFRDKNLVPSWVAGELLDQTD